MPIQRIDLDDDDVKRFHDNLIFATEDTETTEVELLSFSLWSLCPLWLINLQAPCFAQAVAPCFVVVVLRK